jgi:hypothetical protein
MNWGEENMGVRKEEKNKTMKEEGKLNKTNK